MDYIPLILPKDLSVKNTGKHILFRVHGKEYEMRKDTILQLVDLIGFVTNVTHPTDWITGYGDMKKENELELWPSSDEDPILGI